MTLTVASTLKALPTTDAQPHHPPPAPECMAANQDPAVTWDGWVESVSFRSGSDRLRVNVEGEAGGEQRGYLLVGEGPHITTVPRGIDDCRFLCDEIPALFVPDEAIEGFRYTLHNVVSTELRLSFEIDMNEIYAAWCEAQPPLADEINEGQYRCQPNTGGRTEADRCWLTPAGRDPIEFPCCRMPLCDHFCECTADGCEADRRMETVDLFLSDGVASGTTPFGTGHLESR